MLQLSRLLTPHQDSNTGTHRYLALSVTLSFPGPLPRCRCVLQRAAQTPCRHLPPYDTFSPLLIAPMLHADASFSVQPGPPTATFHRLPRKRVLTLNVDVPESWLVEAVEVGFMRP